MRSTITARRSATTRDSGKRLATACIQLSRAATTSECPIQPTFPVQSKILTPVPGDYDHYGDTEAFRIFPDWQRQLSKFASVQDRLREWKPSVARRIEHFACINISMLDIDGFRIDKATQITVDMLGDWADSVRQCARRFGKNNFSIPGEVTGGDTFGSIYLGRG